MGDLLWMVNKIRYMKPLESLWESKLITVPLAVIGMFVDRVFNLFNTDWDLITILTLAVIVDMLTGIIASKVRKTPLSSLGLRQTIIKVIEYALFLSVLIPLANGVETYAVDDSSWILQNISFIMKDVDVLAFLIMIWAEIISIGENITNNKGGIKRIINGVTKLIDKEFKK